MGKNEYICNVSSKSIHYCNMHKTNKLKHLITVLASTALLCVAVSACNDDSADYLGTWKHMPKGDSLYRGFSLGSHGIALSLNQTEKQYNKWHRKRDTLWLSGKQFCDSAVTPFTDTMIVKKLTPDSLVLQSKDGVLHLAHE